MTSLTTTGTVRTPAFAADWRSFTHIQGGLLVGHLLAAAADATGADPRSVTAHLLGGVEPGRPTRITTSPDRTGATGSVRAELWQDDDLRVVAQVLTLARDASPSIEPGPGASPSTPEDGVPFELPTDFVPVGAQTEIRALGPERPLAGGPDPHLEAWVRVREHLEPLVQLGVVADALPPSLFAVRRTPAVMPTAEFTVHVLSEPPAAGSWLRVDQRTVWHDARVAVDDADLRDTTGALVARVRQTRRLLRSA